MIKMYSGLKGIGVFLFFIAGIVFIGLVFFWGVAKAAELVLPFLGIVSAILILLFLCFVLPLSFIKKYRPHLCRYSILMSNVLGVTTWMMSFLFVIRVLGFWGILFSFLFKFLAPMALLGAGFKGSWDIAGQLSLLIVFTYAMRFYSRRLSVLDTKIHQKARIIDVEVVR
ncbi:MAG: hypothetical protein HQL14_00260 [Candidatus Omnitrophica bacterium]|nr:hypothetical protein [Candidatus Omnitrophota bacterium]